MKIKPSGAITYSLLYKAWQAGAGLVTIPIVLHTLGPAVQGYYYTFLSLVALQSFFELGFSIVISIFASHEWHKLRLDGAGKISGDADALSRLVSLGRLVFKHFGFASLAYLVVAGTAGVVILGRSQGVDVSWLGPWMLHILFSAAGLWLAPGLSVLEGCNQVASVAKFRLLQSLASSGALWLALTAGCQLWSLPISACVGWLALLFFIGKSKKDFFVAFLRKPTAETLSWKNDLLPMQWRLAIQALFSYLTFPLYTVLAYSYLGAVEAGRMGMTLQILGGIQAFSLVFLVARAPEFALLVASNRRAMLVSRCKSVAGQTLGAMTVLSLLVGLALLVASELRLPFAARLLSVDIFAIFCVGIWVSGIVQIIAVFLRAHKRELLTLVGVISGALYGLSAWLMCMGNGSWGIAISYATVSAGVVLPLSLLTLKLNYHRLTGGGAI